MDIEYVRSTAHVPPSVGERKAHVIEQADYHTSDYLASCGRTVGFENAEVHTRLPATWRLCGVCARTWASQEDET